MSTQLTQEDKARIFAMYLGSECSDRNGEHFESMGLTYMFGEMHVCHYPNCNVANAVSDCKLHLYDLSDISDEDAIEVCKAVDPYIITDLEYNVVREFHSISVIDTEYGRYVKIYDLTGSVFASGNQNCASGAIDKLRELKYSVPYKGINLFDAGIAIRKTKTITQ